MALPKFVSGLKSAMMSKAVSQGQLLIGTNNDGTATLYADVTDKTDDVVKRFEIKTSNEDEIIALASRITTLEDLVSVLNEHTFLDVGSDTGGGNTGGGDNPNPGGNDNPDPGTGTGGDDPDPGTGGGNDDPQETESNILDDVEEATISTFDDTIIVSWMDPGDKYENGELTGEWAGTVLVRKEGSAPANYNDGVVVVNSTEQDQYLENGYEDTGLTRGVTYYYRLCPYTTTGAYTNGTVLNATPHNVRISAPTWDEADIYYDGTEKSPVFVGYDSDAMTVTGNTGTTPASYTALFTPKNGYCWQDDTTASIPVTWVIQKGGHDLSVTRVSATIETSDGSTMTGTPADSGPFNKDNNTIAVNNKSNTTETWNVVNVIGTLSVSSNNSSVTVSITSNDSITVVYPAGSTYNATILITDSGDSLYDSSTLTIILSHTTVKIVSWANGTDSQIIDMVTAADNGEINLADYWSVGDCREMVREWTTEDGSTATTSPIPFYLAHAGGYDLQTRTNGGRDKCSFIIISKGYTGEYLTSDNYDVEQNRTFSYFPDSFMYDSTLLPLDKYGNRIGGVTSIFKKFKVIYRYGDSYTSDYVKGTIPAEKEVFGTIVNSYPAEADQLSQLDYFKTVSNRLLYNSRSEKYLEWMTRSPSTTPNNACGVSTTGEPINYSLVFTGSKSVYSYPMYCI